MGYFARISLMPLLESYGNTATALVSLKGGFLFIFELNITPF
jgi:hypothetical protein